MAAPSYRDVSVHIPDKFVTLKVLIRLAISPVIYKRDSNIDVIHGKLLLQMGGEKRSQTPDSTTPLLNNPPPRPNLTGKPGFNLPPAVIKWGGG